MSKIRFGGMATGLDTDTLIKQMMQPHRMKIDKQKQDKQIIQWRQDLYRELISDIRGLKNSYLDNIKPNDNLLMQRNYSAYDVTNNSATGVTVATAKAGVGAVAGNYVVNVTSLASGAKVSGETMNNSVKSSDVIDVSSWEGEDITITIDGTSTTFKLELDFPDLTGLSDSEKLNKLSQYINDGFDGKINVTNDGSRINFASIDSKTVIIESTIADLGNKVINPKGSSTNLSEMGIAVDEELNVNGTIITISDPSNMTIQQFTDKIARDTNGAVSARYSELTGQFSFETKRQGELATLKISGSEKLMQALKIDNGIVKDVNGIIALGEEPNPIKGKYAIVDITPPGGVLTAVIGKETNDFTIDGISYSLKGAGETTLSVTENTDKTYDKVMGFITKYNEIIDKVKEKIEQKKKYSFTPLTDDQKKDMKEEEIKIWEEKAKEGLIKGDNSLNAMLTSMRSAFFDSVGEPGSISLKDLGFTTSRDTTQRGKIVIDESLTADEAKKKFSDALKSNGAGVAGLFSKSSETYKDKGIFQRLNEIVEDYTKPFGEKGILLKKAGIKGNSTEFNNLLSEQMVQKDKFISELNRKLATRETDYYAKFAKLEKAMNKMNSQSSWLMQQLGGGQ